MKLFHLMFFSLFFSWVSFADQCIYLSAKQAQKAERLLSEVQEVLSYCELCDGAKPTLIAFKKVEVYPNTYGYSEIRLDGKAYDLAYLFLPHRTEPEVFENLSKKVGCASTGVSTTVEYSIDQGLLSTPDSWAGRYGKKEVTWILNKISGTLYQIEVDFHSKLSGNDKGKLTSVSELKENLRLETPLPGCRFLMTVEKDLLRVHSSEACGALGSLLRGVFPRQPS